MCWEVVITLQREMRRNVSSENNLVLCLFGQVLDFPSHRVLNTPVFAQTN